MSRRVLILSRNYPNAVLPEVGLWVEGFVRHSVGPCEPRVIAPVPYWPPLPWFEDYARFRRVPPRTRRGGVDVCHPRFLTGPASALHSVEATTMYWGVRRCAARLAAETPIDLIHACFSYPEGVVAARLGRDLGRPVVITEHASWRPWMDRYPRVRRQAVRAVQAARLVIAPSRYARSTITHFVGDSPRLHVVPNGVDGRLFRPLPPGQRPNPDQILFVGFLNHTKGVDVLLRAVDALRRPRPALRLVLVGGSFYAATRPEEAALRRLVRELGLEAQVTFAGVRSPAEVAAHMRESAVLVLPSRRETFGSVLVEALACGTPVVATRCGGPEDIVTDEVGRLVPSEDPRALTEAIAEVLAGRSRYDPAALRAYALARFGWEQIIAQTVALYDTEVAGKGKM